MVFGGQFFNCFLFFCYIWPSTPCGGYISPSLFASIIWKSFLKYERCLWNCKLQFHGHHFYFRTDFQKSLAINIGHIWPPHHALGQIIKQIVHPKPSYIAPFYRIMLIVHSFVKQLLLEFSVYPFSTNSMHACYRHI